MLLAGGLIPYYWCAENSRGAVDFLGQHKGEVLLESLVRVLKALEAMKRQSLETEALKDAVNAPVLLDCPVNYECTVVASVLPEGGSNELFIGRVDAVHVDEEFVSPAGKILWGKLDLI